MLSWPPAFVAIATGATGAFGATGAPATGVGAPGLEPFAPICIYSIRIKFLLLFTSLPAQILAFSGNNP